MFKFLQLIRKFAFLTSSTVLLSTAFTYAMDSKDDGNSSNSTYRITFCDQAPREAVQNLEAGLSKYNFEIGLIDRLPPPREPVPGGRQYHAFLAHKDIELVGGVLYFIDDEFSQGGTVGEIHTLYVKTESRKKGFGKILMSLAIESLEKKVFP